MGMGTSIPLKFRPSPVEYFDGLSIGWEQGRSECPSEAVVILVFHIDNCLLGPYGCRKWDVGAASQWLISSDVQPEGLHLVNYPPRPSLRPLFEQLQEMGDGFVKGCFNFAGLKFDAIESQDLFCQFLAYMLAHTFEKSLGSAARGCSADTSICQARK